MEKKVKHYQRRGGLFRCISPLLIYVSAELMASMVVVMSLAQRKGINAANYTSVDDLYIILLKELSDNYEMVNYISMMLAYLIIIPIFYRLYKKDRAMNVALGIETWSVKIPAIHYLLLPIAAFSFCMAGSSMMSMTKLAQSSVAYQETAQALYGGSIWIELLTLGILAPLAEELLFRGLVYLRLRERNPMISAMIISAAVFGSMHGNMVQAVYGTACGLFLAYIYERYDCLKACVLVHMIANFTAVIASETTAFDFLFTEQTTMYISTFFLCLLFMGCLYYIELYVRPYTAEYLEEMTKRE